MKIGDILKRLAAMGAICLFAACGEKDKGATEVADSAEEQADVPTATEAEGEAAQNLETPDQQLSYAIGFQMGSRYANDDIIDLDSELMIQGLKDALAGKESIVSEEETHVAGQAMQQRFEAKRAEEAEASKAVGLAFLEENKAKEGVVTTESGLQYEIITKGDSEEHPAATDQVTVHYHGTFIDGGVFDSSVERDSPSTFGLNAVISGWTEGVQLMSVGDKFRFFVPSELAYGPNGRDGIPPHSVLIFEVELLEIGG